MGDMEEGALYKEAEYIRSVQLLAWLVAEHRHEGEEQTDHAVLHSKSQHCKVRSTV